VDAFDNKRKVKREEIIRELIRLEFDPEEMDSDIGEAA